MPTFPTPEPLDLAIDLQVGAIDIIASERADTAVTVTPSNPDRAVDVRGAEQTTVEFDGRRLTVVGPRPRLSWIGPTESVDLRIELPATSRVTAEIAVGGVRTTGALGATRIKSSMGTVELEQIADLWMRAGHGTASVGRATGSIDITADHGQIRVGVVAGDATLKASHGSIRVGESAGDVDAKLSYGDLEITHALASVSAKTAYGSIRIDEVSRGDIQLQSGYGQVEVGVRPGVPAWLDLASKEGHVRNGLDGDGAPDPAEPSVAVRARTQFGDITVRRAG
ncbi:hypothetical protein B7R54_04885 [Subtercola boreus]|uniref:DUF4097 domain-containing protein n=1 Tax=Subtercola boreus TaxID=120213 RepID=A0A3E0VG51_9MICO|nr:DUF4097 family beta strand repeat-containing protein [Subtercola boreus]RFA08639.1 hypothetical protein B7R54_04885 [Subtercola boreus]TQL54420.1 putative adhesin [Subtercola boreus]